VNGVDLMEASEIVGTWTCTSSTK